MKTDTLLRTDEVCRLTGCTFRMLDYWNRCDVVQPTIQARGSGTRRRWTLDDTAAVRLAVVLGEMCMPLDMTRSVLKSLRARPKLWTSSILITPNGTVRPASAPYRDGWLVNLAGCRSYVGAEPVWSATA